MELLWGLNKLRHVKHRKQHQCSKKLYKWELLLLSLGFPGGSEGEASACDAEDPGSIPGSGRSPGEGNGNPLQYSCSLSHVQLCDLWTVAHQAPLSMGFSRITADSDCSHEIKRHLLLGRKVMTNLESILKSRHYFANKGPSSQGYGFTSSHARMWELDYKESWAPKN